MFIINSKFTNYPVFFEKDYSFIEKWTSKKEFVFIVDSNVWKLHDLLHELLPGERTRIESVCEDWKSLDSVSSLYTWLLQFPYKRNLCIIVLGGGILQDVVGFVASTLYRGISWIAIPTTLLAQSDSCIGGKTGVNFHGFKNMIGSFYPPHEVHILTNFIKTLSKNDYFSGLGEIAKAHLMSGEDIAKKFAQSLQDLILCNDDLLVQCIEQSLKLKCYYIEADENDSDLRNMLNYGHCVGHALESISNFSIPHGQAVVWGMVFANDFAVHCGLLSPDTSSWIYDFILKPILLHSLPNYSITDLLQAMKQDKKNTGNGLSLIVLCDHFKMQKVTSISTEEMSFILQNRLSYHKF